MPSYDSQLGTVKFPAIFLSINGIADQPGSDSGATQACHNVAQIHVLWKHLAKESYRAGVTSVIAIERGGLREAK